MADAIITRTDARAQGIKFYFTGKPCPMGHVTRRFVSTCGCVDCGLIKSRTRDAARRAARGPVGPNVPAKREGLRSVWINRRHDRPGWGATPQPADEWTYNLEFNSMGDFADAVDGAFTGTRGQGGA